MGKKKSKKFQPKWGKIQGEIYKSGQGGARNLKFGTSKQFSMLINMEEKLTPKGKTKREKIDFF